MRKGNQRNETHVLGQVENDRDSPCHARRVTRTVPRSRGKRILILYQEMGSGHKRVARLIETALRNSSDGEILCMPGNALLESRFTHAFELFWNAVMRRNWVRLADGLGAFFTRIAILPFLDATIGPELHKRLELLKPDIIVSTMDGFNKALGAYCKRAHVPFHIFITSSAVFSDNVSAAAHHLCYFKEMAETIQGFDMSAAYFSKDILESSCLGDRLAYVLGCLRDYLFHSSRGIFRNLGSTAPVTNVLRCTPVGPCTDSKFFTPKQNGDLRRQLGIDSADPCVVVVSGGLGSRAVSDAVKTVARGSLQPLNIIAVCGKDRATYERVRKCSGHDGIQIVPTEFVDNFEEYLDLADCVAIRPSSGVFNEALVCRRPCVILPWATSNDKGIPWLVNRYGLGEVCSRLCELPQKVQNVLEHKEEHIQNIDRFLAPYPRDFEATARLIADAILGDSSANAHFPETAVMS